MDIIRVLAQKVGEIGTLAWQPLLHLDLGRPLAQILTVTLESPLLAAFQMMVAANARAACVVDSEGVLVVNLSASDVLQLQTPADWELLHKSVGHFLEVKDLPSRYPAVVRAFSLRPTTTLRRCLDTFVESGMHQVRRLDSPFCFGVAPC